MRINITANGTGVINQTTRDNNHFYAFVTSGSTYGGGTLTLSIKDTDTAGALIAIDTPIAGAQGQYAVGGGVDLHWTLTGATTPNIDLMVTQGR